MKANRPIPMATAMAVSPAKAMHVGDGTRPGFIPTVSEPRSSMKFSTFILPKLGSMRLENRRSIRHVNDRNQFEPSESARETALLTWMAMESNTLIGVSSGRISNGSSVQAKIYPVRPFVLSPQ